MERLARPLLVVLGFFIPLVPIAEARPAGNQTAGPDDVEVRRLQDYYARGKLEVRLLDGIAAALPEHLWLDRLTVSAEKVAIEGRAFNTNAIANFIENLDKLPDFSAPSLRSTTEARREIAEAARYQAAGQAQE